MTPSPRLRIGDDAENDRMLWFMVKVIVIALIAIMAGSFLLVVFMALVIAFDSRSAIG